MDAWVTDDVAAEATYGHIRWWDTGVVTDMSRLFCGFSDPLCTATTQKQSFNDDISHW